MTRNQSYVISLELVRSLKYRVNQDDQSACKPYEGEGQGVQPYKPESRILLLLLQASRPIGTEMWEPPFDPRSLQRVGSWTETDLEQFLEETP